MEGNGMPQKEHKPEGIVAMPRRVDVLVSRAQPVAEAVPEWIATVGTRKPDAERQLGPNETSPEGRMKTGPETG
jgi:hypothetical protein